MTKKLGEKLNPVLLEIESTIWLSEADQNGAPCFTHEGFRAVTKLFFTALMDKMWALQEAEKMDLKTRSAMSDKAGNEVRNLIKTYTGIETREMYNSLNNF